MSILIHGMELPPKGTRLFVAVNWCGDVYLITSGAEIITKYQPSAKAVELPPHAGILDYDSLDPDSEWSYYEDGYTAYSMNAIRAACIPAEEE